MSLFPAYTTECELDDDSMSPGAECALLEEPSAAPPAPTAPCVTPPDNDAPYYIDRRLDVGNLRVSTLYYPARPEYRSRSSCDPHRDRVRHTRRAVRYWRGITTTTTTGCDEDSQCAARAANLRANIDNAPHDELLWLQYIDFLVWCGDRGGGETAAEAAIRAASRLPHADAVRSALAGLLPASELARHYASLRVGGVGVGAAAVTSELWAREVSAWTCCGRLTEARDVAVRAAGDRAIADHGHVPLFVYGATLRSAGLWERMVQLVELVMAMNFPDDGQFAKAAAAAGSLADAGADQLAAWETTTATCGLPASAVWARVERARAALHWRAPHPAHIDPTTLAADPQRVPPPAADADLLRVCTAPAPALRLLVTMLRLAEEPLLPGSGAAARGAAGSVGSARLMADWDAAGGALLVSLLYAARRLPPGAGVGAGALPTREVRALTPLRAVPANDTTGFGVWRAALWDAALQSTAGRRRRALLCWRLRALHAARGSAHAARRLLRRYSDNAATPYALYARIEDVPERATAAARGAVRRALRPPCDMPAALHAARVLHELDAAAGRWALLCCCTSRPLPPDDELHTPPPLELEQAAILAAEEQCAQLERLLLEEHHDDEEEPEDALLPSSAEWGAARVMLVIPYRRRQLELELQRKGACRSAAGARYNEQCACTLASLASQEHRAGDVARALRHHAPHNAYIALLATTGRGCLGGGGGGALSEGAVWRYAALLPAIVRAVQSEWDRNAAIALERAAARTACGGGGDAAGGALAASLRVEGAAAALTPSAAALTAALHVAPLYKWVYVRGAALGAGCATDLADMILERGLRLHALPDELPLLAATAHTAHTAAHTTAHTAALL